jgi:hypothetical protein
VEKLVVCLYVCVVSEESNILDFYYILLFAYEMDKLIENVTSSGFYFTRKEYLGC